MVVKLRTKKNICYVLYLFVNIICSFNINDRLNSIDMSICIKFHFNTSLNFILFTFTTSDNYRTVPLYYVMSGCGRTSEVLWAMSPRVNIGVDTRINVHFAFKVRFTVSFKVQPLLFEFSSQEIDWFHLDKYLNFVFRYE